MEKNEALWGHPGQRVGFLMGSSMEPASSKALAPQSLSDNGVRLQSARDLLSTPSILWEVPWSLQKR